MLAFMRVQPPGIRIAIVRRACGFREIVSAVAGAIDGDAGTLRSKRNEFDRDDIGEAEYRRARYVDGAPVLKLGNHQDRCRLDDHFLPIFAQLVPWHIKYRARHVCGGAVTRRAGEIAGPRQGPTEISDAYRLVGARRSSAGRPRYIRKARTAAMITSPSASTTLIIRRAARTRFPPGSRGRQRDLFRSSLRCKEIATPRRRQRPLGWCCARRSNARTRAAQYPDFRDRRSADALARRFTTALLVYRKREPFDRAVSVSGPGIS